MKKKAVLKRKISIFFIVMLIMSIMTPFAFADDEFDTYLEKGAWSANDAELDPENTASCIISYLVKDGYDAGDKWTASDRNNLKALVKKYGSTTPGTDDLMTVQINSDDYHLNATETKKIQSHIASVAKKKTVKSSVDQVAEFEVKADVSAAHTALSGVESIISTCVGILVYAVTIGMTLFTACDICYITMPVFRNKCDDMKQAGSVGTKTTSSGETKLMFVTDDAQYAVQSCSVDTGKNPLGVYMKKRVVAFILLGLVLFILFTGNIQLIVNVVVNIAAGIVDALSGLGG